MFQRLHPALRHHIVNTFGWSSLRPVQDETIPHVLDGDNVVVLAPTAGGKTEAAFFPALTKCLEEEWEGLSILYLSPIRALLNNQAERIHELTQMLGLTSALWHGDVKAGDRKRIMKEPPSVLLTTPESIEAICISRKRNHQEFFENLKLVIIDEVHAFAGDDRGWHLLAILERLQEISGHDLQRIGLSATVGNPPEIAQWLCGSSERPSAVVDPPASVQTPPDVTVDWVATLANAARIVAKLHRGKKRLVFCDSRAQCESLASYVRSLGEETYVSHSSLSADERRRTERAFAEGGPGVIIATSALELGIDIGDLDHVIQIDAPYSVASFLQRMGRTGRRAGTTANCLFLAVTDTGLLRAVALVNQWRREVVEAAEAPKIPYHISGQQMLAEALAAPGIPVDKLRRRASRFADLWEGTEEELDHIYQSLTEREFVFEDGGRASLGQRAEKEVGRKNFMKLVSVFTSTPMFQAMFGNRPIGEVDRRVLDAGGDDDGAQLLMLAGRTWLVRDINWKRKRVWMEPWEQGRGKAAWIGDGQGVGPDLADSHYRVFCGSQLGSECWSSRAREQLEGIHNEFFFLSDTRQTAVQEENTVRLFTFAGFRANQWIADSLRDEGWSQPMSSGIAVAAKSVEMDLERAMDQLKARVHAGLLPEVDEHNQDLKSLKFSEILPRDTAIRAYQARRYDVERAHATILGDWKRVSLG